MTAEQYLTVKDVYMLVISDGNDEEYRPFNLVPLLDAGAGGVLFYVDTKSEERLSGLNVQHKIQTFLRKTGLQKSQAYISWPGQDKNIKLTKSNFFNSLLLGDNLSMEPNEQPSEAKNEQPVSVIDNVKISDLFQELITNVNNAAVVSTSGNVKETCLSLAGIISNASDIQSVLLLGELNSPIKHEEVKAPVSNFPTFSVVCDYLLNYEIPNKDFVLEVDVDRNTGSILMRLNMEQKTFKGGNFIVEGDLEGTVKKVRENLNIHKYYDPTLFLYKMNKDLEFTEVEMLINIERFPQWISEELNKWYAKKIADNRKMVQAMTPITLEGFRNRLATDGKDYMYHDFHITTTFNGGMFRVIFVIDKDEPRLSAQEVSVKIDAYIDTLDENDKPTMMNGFLAISWSHSPGIIAVSPNTVFTSGIVSLAN